MIRDPLFRQPFARWCAIASAALLAGAWSAILAIPNTPGVDVIVHYTTTFGIDALGRWMDLLRLPLTGTVFLVINLVTARIFSAPDAGDQTPESDELAAVSGATRLLLVATMFLEFAVLVGALLLLHMNLAS